MGATAQEVAGHIKETWRRGAEAVGMLRNELGNEADRLVPLRKGGVRLLKIKSTMGDTCNKERAIMKLVTEMKEEDGIAFYGEETWRALPVVEGCA